MDYTDIVCLLSFGDCDELAQEWLDDIEERCAFVEEVNAYFANVQEAA